MSKPTEVEARAMYERIRAHYPHWPADFDKANELEKRITELVCAHPDILKAWIERDPWAPPAFTRSTLDVSRRASFVRESTPDTNDKPAKQRQLDFKSRAAGEKPEDYE